MTKKKSDSESKKLIAKKDFFFMTDKEYKIKEGDDVAKLKLSEGVLESLKTEKVI